jgi:hypothetical protein
MGAPRKNNKIQSIIFLGMNFRNQDGKVIQKNAFTYFSLLKRIRVVSRG